MRAPNAQPRTSYEASVHHNEAGTRLWMSLRSWGVSSDGPNAKIFFYPCIVLTEGPRMSLNDLKSEFSHAYVRAVAHAAGYFVQEANRVFDGDGVDLTLMGRGNGGVVRSPRLDVQLKSTAQPVAQDPFPFDLDVKNYDELRSQVLQVPRILVVVVVPADRAFWISTTEQDLTVRHCGYWLSLRGLPESNNTATVRVHIPRSSCLHVADLQAIMARVQAGGLP